MEEVIQGQADITALSLWGSYCCLIIIFSNERKKARFAVFFPEKGQELEEAKQRLRREEHKNDGEHQHDCVYVRALHCHIVQG